MPRRLVALLATAGMFGPAAQARATVEMERIALESRVEAVRGVLGAEIDGNSARAPKKITKDKVAQWLNWPNWPNWGNWNNWRNWGNWVNW